MPGCYENVWCKWDADHLLQNLNPCWLAVDRQTVDQPYDALPPVVRRMWDASLTP